MVTKDVNKKIFSDRIASKMGIYKYQAMDMLDAFQEVLEEAVLKGENVYLRDFVSFDVVGVKQRDYRNPQNQEPVKGYPKKKIKTKFCSRLQNILNEQAKEEADEN